MSADTTTKRHEVEVDERIADAYVALKRAEVYYDSAKDSVRHRAHQRQDHRTGRWDGTLENAIAYCEDEAERSYESDGRTVTYRTESGKALDRMEEWRQKTHEALAVYAEAEKAYEGWSRFFAVMGGHVHSSMHCTTCYPTTRFGWLPNLSGLDEAAAVAEMGATLCTVCFPSAPVEWTSGKLDANGKPVQPKTYCEGSGKSPKPGTMRGRYGQCPTCGSAQSVTTTGSVRKHQPPKGVVTPPSPAT